MQMRKKNPCELGDNVYRPSRDTKNFIEEEEDSYFDCLEDFEGGTNEGTLSDLPKVLSSKVYFRIGLGAG